MKKRGKEKQILKGIIFLCILGILTSLYLVQNHYAGIAEGSFCDFGEYISCSLVNTSVFSEFLRVPVALFGAIWFLVGILGALKALKKLSNYLPFMLLWSIAGVGFIIYMIIAEIILKAICPLCTLAHVLTLILFILILILYKKNKPTKKKEVIETTVRWIILAGILFVIPLIALNIAAVTKEQKDYSEFAQCINDKGINMYGSFRCGACAKTREMFGDAFQYINEIECHPQGENAQTELCFEKQIKATPTWILEPQGVEQDRLVGFVSIENLEKLSGCKA